MLKISREGNGYKVATSYPGAGVRGKRWHARDLEEVHQALEHYYGPYHGRDPVDNCPLCEKEAK